MVGCLIIALLITLPQYQCDDDSIGQGKTSLQALAAGSSYACYVLSEQNERTTMNKQRRQYCQDKGGRYTPSFYR